MKNRLYFEIDTLSYYHNGQSEYAGVENRWIERVRGVHEEEYSNLDP